jgi:hypothetical protein
VAIYSDVIYGNSVSGIARLSGEFVGAAFCWWLLRLLLIRRRTKYSNAVIFIIAALSVVVTNAAKFGAGLDGREAREALRGVNADANAVAEVARKHPSNAFLQFLASALATAEEANAAIKRLDNELEPPLLANDVKPATATRAELRAYLAALKTAETNAAQVMPRVRAIVQQKRDKIEALAKSTGVSDDVKSEFLSSLDDKAAKDLDRLARQYTASATLFHALAANCALLTEYHGRYQVQSDGRILFADSGVIEAYGANSRAAQAAATENERLSEEGKKAQRTTFTSGR